MEKKSFLVTLLLCWFLGGLGIHRFYTKHNAIGVIQLITLGCCGIWSFIDLLLICFGKFKDANGQELEDYNQNIGYGVIIFVLSIIALRIVIAIIGASK